MTPVHIVGAGPGVGAAVARRFGRAGHPIGLIARNRSRLDALARDLTADGIDTQVCAADATDPAALAAALTELARRQGPAGVLCFSPLPDVSLIKPVVDTTPADLGAALALSVVGAAASVRAVLPAMRTTGRGSLLFVTGSAVVNPSADRAASAVAGFAEKAYLDLLRDALATTPIQVAHLVVKGAVGVGATHEPDTVADRLWRLHAAPAETHALLE
ncbi:SDR family NAD(P)-dependent oxidoreductase [Cryptosporangium japonicum]|uniref:SDR family NAD(P)-dependent oxidoreductase n=1 Tax=Cryptosporangium japonicum TaxID=80872 RepID=A0ABP3DZ46_9ACTN